MTEPHYYSLRRLSPYLGTVQVVELPGFRAFSADGRTWELQISHQGSRFSSYATWRFDGMGKHLETEHTAPFIEALRKHPKLPFPPADNVELWLLDTHSKLPLALISSTVSGKSPPSMDEVDWYPGLVDDSSFVAPSLYAGQSEDGNSTRFFPHQEVLRRCVRAAAGPISEAQWFVRDDEGGGAGLGGCRIASALQNRHLSYDEFPELIVNEKCWKTQRERNLVRDYHHWQSANLLTHTNLVHDTRDRLERVATRQAEQLYRLRHVLPEIINEKLVKTAFVEAMIRSGARPGI